MLDLRLLDPHHDLLAEAVWEMCVTEASAWSGPQACNDTAGWIAATVPGTAAAALAEAGRFDPAAPQPLHDRDVWYRTRLAPRASGAHRLVSGGLATICEAWLDGAPILISDDMFATHEIALDLDGPAELLLCFRALTPHLARKGPRARWRTQLADHAGLRLVRTTLLGRMPGWCPSIHAVGTWRPLALVPETVVEVEDVRLDSALEEDGTGRLTVSLRLAERPAGGQAEIVCAGWRAPLDPAGDGVWRAEMLLPGIEAWWPHTHGTPHLHEVTLDLGDRTLALGRTGFRRLTVDRGPDGDGFGLLVNGVPVFCRGAVWTNADLLRLPCDADDYRPWLALAREAGMNMLRIGGTMAPEGPAFFDLCDELGLLVWQDLPFANFDYPVKDEGFVEAVARETRDLMGLAGAAPSLAVVCGGSEMYQQGAMTGVGEDRWRGPLTTEILPATVAEVRPDAVYVENSPSGGALPFSPNAGIAHYYGVGAYRRPLEDARRANVRFAAECLAFSNVPEADDLPGAAAPGHDPAWKGGVPRDRGVGWDFEDVRDHYVQVLYGVDPRDLRYGDPQAYLDHGRAAVAEVMDATFAEWRRPGSSCRGALVWTFQDLAPGAGWGVVDHAGRPKSAWYALKRAFRPLKVSVTDEGTNGLALHLANDTGEARPVRVEIACLREGRLAVASGATDLTLAAHDARTLAATDLIGAFFDVTHAYRFGPPSHDTVHVRLADPDTDATLDEAFHFPLGRGRIAPGAALSVQLRDLGDAGFALDLETDRVAQSVAIRDDALRPEDNWFHLAPGRVKTVRLLPAGDATPGGHVVALGGTPVFYSAA
ncbi:glycoside hydrolase family 2 protein [Stappia sp.]|uniref:glycosyl hydrolase 2 galactose-binding domain-containing protein n=1 Tax=Stappia sp. TaxID=1870903 RepID=UPI0032D8B7AD